MLAEITLQELIKKFFTLTEHIIRTKKQLTWTRFFLFLFSKVSMKLFDRYMIPSFSQFGEDRIIECYFSGQNNGFYVDVGCNHPISYSNTWKLYLKGWRGIVIDANPDLISEYRKIRPKDIAIQKVISNQQKVVEFYFSKTSHLISGIGEKSDGYWKRTPYNSNIVKCDSATLYDVLQNYNVCHQFDLLSIDVEGSELDVLDSLHLETFSPKLIAIEIHEFDISRPNLNAVYKKLSDHGYRMIGYLNPTGFFSSKGE